MPNYEIRHQFKVPGARNILPKIHGPSSEDWDEGERQLVLKLYDKYFRPYDYGEGKSVWQYTGDQFASDQPNENYFRCMRAVVYQLIVINTMGRLSGATATKTFYQLLVGPEYRRKLFHMIYIES